MEATIEQVTITRLKVFDTEVLLEDRGPGRGQITITGYGNNYSFFWGAMGGTLAEFLCGMNKEYFASKLMGAKDDNEVDVKKTFAAIRKWIREDHMKWFQHMEFQQRMRSDLKDFQERMEDYPDERYFVDTWYRVAEGLDYYLIDDRWVEKDFKSAMNDCEPWHFIIKKPNKNYLWLATLHGHIKKALKQTLNNTPS